MQSFGNYNINPNPPVYVGGGEKRKKKKEEKPSEDIASKIALPIAVTAGAALAICAGVFGVNKALGGGKKVVGETAKKTAGTVKETAKKANKTIQEQQQEISKILKNLQAGQEFTKNEATQLTQYLTAYTSALTLGKYPGLDITSYTQLINNFIKNINKKFKGNSVESIDIDKNSDPLIEDIGKINNMFDQIEKLVKSQNQSSEINQNIEKINIEVEEEEKPKPEHVPNENPKCGNKMGYPSISSNNTLELSVETLDKFKNIQYVSDGTKYLLCLDTEVEVGDEALANKHVDIDGVTIDKSKQAFQVEFEDGKKTYAYYQELKLDMPYADIETLLENQKIKLELINYKDNFLQQYLKKQAEKVSDATADDLKPMIEVTQKVTSVLKSTKGIGDDVKANISNANTNLIKAIQQKQLNANLKAFDDDKDSSKLFDNFASLKTLISTYNLEANSIYYIDSNNEWKKVEEKVPDNAKFVIEVKDQTTDVTITKKAPYCDLVYDKDGHITVKATPAKKYIDIITADEKSLKQNVPDLKCTISDDDKKTALKNLKDLLQINDDFKEAYKTARGDKKYNEDFKPVGGGIFKNSSGGILTQLLNADLDTAIKLLTPTKKNKDILAALNTTTITSDTYTEQSALNAAIAATDKTPYLKDILTTNTTSKKLPLFSGDTKEEYITKIDGDKTVYTSKGNSPKEYTVTYDNSKNTVTITVDGNPYTYTVSENECTLDQNVPAENKDLFEHFVYMALPDDNKKKAFAHYLLKQIPLTDMVKTKNNQVTEETKALQKKVLRLIMAATDKNSNEYKFAQKLLNKEDVERNRYLFIDNSHNITSGCIKQKPQKCVYIYKRTTSDNAKYTISFYSQGLT
ncbi:MAG: hypothetical protein MRZ90_02055 [Candidatus Gastranaerophilales bacterium]|nr:hypothetical protein [Candidatus Gastranaerophilales bacterium]